MNLIAFKNLKFLNYLVKQISIAIGIFLISSSSFANSVFGPHQPPRIGPWFEGWYARVTDTRDHRSFAVIAATITVGL